MLHDTSPTFPAITLTSYHYAAVMHWLKKQLPLYRGTAVKILWEIADRTFGHRKWEDVISLSQFAACGMGRDTVLVIVAHLLELGIISRRPVGNSYAYRINIPDDLFSERPGATDRDDCPVDTMCDLIHTEAEAVSFFTQNSESYPQNGDGLAGRSSSQIDNVTLGGNGWNRWEELFTALTDVNATLPRTAYALRNLPRWVTRAITLGMSWGDVWTLWRACQRVGRKPVALFLSRLMADGSLPGGKRLAVRPLLQDTTKQMFAAMLD
jgi:hypothetical protein